MEEILNGLKDDKIKILLGDLNARFGSKDINTNKNNFKRKNKDKKKFE